jgi:hypothetical protein
MAMNRVPEASGRHWLLSPAARAFWLTVLLGAVILGARRPTELARPQFWAEDGLIFYTDAQIHGDAALTRPYSGYLHTVPRLVAAVSTRFDPVRAPGVFVVAALLLTVYVAVRTQSARFPLPVHPAFALAVVLVPDAYEVLLFQTNVQWVLAGGLVLLLISADAKAWWQHAHDLVAAVLLGLTGPFSVMLAPFFCWRAWHRRTRASAILAGAILLCAGLQAWMIWRNPIVMPGEGFAAEKVLAVPALRIGGSLFAGYFVPQGFPLILENVIGLAVLGGVTWLAARPGPARLERLWLGGAFLVLLAASLHRCRHVLPDLCHAGFGARYFFPLQLIVLWLLAALAVTGPRWASRCAAALLLWALAVNLPRLREPGLADLDWRGQAGKIRTGEAVAIPTNPGGEPWFVRLPARK